MNTQGQKDLVFSLLIALVMLIDPIFRGRGQLVFKFSSVGFFREKYPSQHVIL